MVGIQSVLHDQSRTGHRLVGLSGGGPQSVDDHQRFDAPHDLHDPRASRDERRQRAAIRPRPGQDAARRAQSTDRIEGHRRVGHFGVARMGAAAPHGRKCQQL